jgi:hypothetical protein
MNVDYVHRHQSVQMAPERAISMSVYQLADKRLPPHRIKQPPQPTETIRSSYLKIRNDKDSLECQQQRTNIIWSTFAMASTNKWCDDFAAPHRR